MGLRPYAKNAMAPVGPKAEIIRGKATVKIPAKNRFTATARLIPTSFHKVSGADMVGVGDNIPRWKRGNASAE